MPNILKDQFKIGFQYYDLQVDDKKLVQLNVEDAKKKGATIIQNRKVIDAKRNKNIWDITLDDKTILKSKILINAAGPWINEVLSNVIKLNSNKSIRLVKGSHIITKNLIKMNILLLALPKQKFFHQKIQKLMKVKLIIY